MTIVYDSPRLRILQRTCYAQFGGVWLSVLEERRIEKNSDGMRTLPPTYFVGQRPVEPNAVWW